MSTSLPPTFSNMNSFGIIFIISNNKALAIIKHTFESQKKSKKVSRRDECCEMLR